MNKAGEAGRAETKRALGPQGWHTVGVQETGQEQGEGSAHVKCAHSV